MTLAAPVSSRTLSFTRTEIRHDGVAVLTLDDPRETHVTFTPELADAMTRELDRLERDDKVKAIVVRSAKKDSFVVGANIGFVQKIRFAKDAADMCAEANKRFSAIDAKGRKPVVACVHGSALGGGFELSLACTAAVASDDRKTVLGLPEVKLGLMPAANGLLRVAERAGLRVAIDLGLSGRSLRPARAYALGLVDEVVAPAVLLDAACALAKKLAERPEHRKLLPRARRLRSARGLKAIERALVENNPVGRRVLFTRARREATAKTRGHYPATERMLDELERFGARGFAAAAKLEPRLFGECVVSETAHRLIELFFAQAAIKKDTGLEKDETAAPHPVERVSVLGAGLMGAGIAYVTVNAQIPVRMKDRDDVALGRGLRYVREVLDERTRRGSLAAVERDRTFALLSGATDFTGLKNADLVIEAVFEDLALKHEIFREVEKLVSADCVLASNTSSLPIASIAEGCARPERVVGMHYTSPVPRMPLLEVVRTKMVDPRAIATAVAVGKRQGKTVIVVRDGTGFYTTRILAPLLNEAAHLLAEGVSVDAIDRAMVDWGFPEGPLHLLDDVGIDVAAHVGAIMHGAFGDRMEAPATMTRLVADDRRGKKNGRGFYLYGRGPKAEKRVDDTVYEIIGVRPHKTPLPDEVGLRCALAMINEALRCLDEKIVRSARDGDVGAVFGVGFPAFRGGPFRYVDVIGAAEVLKRTRSLEQRFGARFEPAPLLVEMARKGGRFYG